MKRSVVIWRRNSIGSSWTAAILALVSACATGRSPNTSGERPPHDTRITLPRTVITPEETTSVPELYLRATELARRSEYKAAAVIFDRIVALEPEDGELAHDALFESAAAYDQAALFEESAARYERYAQRFPRTERAQTALMRATLLSLHLERWERAGELAQRALAAGLPLGPFQQVTAYSASALARLSADDEQAASTFIEKGRAVVDTHQLDAAGRIGRELAALYYALGELRRRRADRIVFDPMPTDFADALERRCQLLLDAQSAYSDTMRAYDAHWSTMAGYRVGQLYHRLHADVMNVKPPAAADTQQKRDLFEAAMRLRFAILLQKALGMVEHTIAMAERTGERSSWVGRLNEARSEIAGTIQREEQALARLPYSRATIEAALDDLTRRAEAQAKKRLQASPPPSPR